MSRVHVFCEGQTEDTFLREVLRPHFERLNIWLNPIVLRTGPQGKGGVTSFGKLRWQVERKCKEDPSAWVTTLIDLYGLPTDFPAHGTGGNSFQRADAIEAGMRASVNQPNFVPNLLVHEFEGLLLSCTDAFGNWFDDADVVETLTQIRQGFESPEHINDGVLTAPSKRIRRVCKSYDKIVHGSLISLDIGLDVIRDQCPRFDVWIRRLEGFGGL